MAAPSSTLPYPWRTVLAFVAVNGLFVAALPLLRWSSTLFRVDDAIPLSIFSGLFLGECLVAGAWSALTPHKRNDPVVLGAIWACGTVLFAAGITFAFCASLFFGVVYWLVALIIFRAACTWRGWKISAPGETSVARRWTFGIRDLMLLTAVIAADIALIKAVFFRDIGNEREGWIGATSPFLFIFVLWIFPALIFAQAAMATLAVLGGSRRWAAVSLLLLVVLPTTQIVMVSLLIGPGPFAAERFVIAVNFTIFVVVLANLLVLRLGGYRLVKRQAPEAAA